MKTAILVDGAFYLRRAQYLFGSKSPKERAEELMRYCRYHLDRDDASLYRIFYYDCPPSDKTVFHPLTQKTVSLRKTPLYQWQNDFFAELSSKRKVALRKGEPLESSGTYQLRPDAVKKLCRREITVDDLTEHDFALDIQQKGVDMRMGLDIASIAHKKLVDQIVLISGDSDFVPAAKHARREGIDFILDPMWHTISDSLHEHIDGLRSQIKRMQAHSQRGASSMVPPDSDKEDCS